MWPQPQPQKLIMISLGTKENLAGPPSQLRLDVENTGQGASIVCSEGGTAVWRDQVKGPVLRATGNLNFSAVALADGSLIVSDALCSLLHQIHACKVTLSHTSQLPSRRYFCQIDLHRSQKQILALNTSNPSFNTCWSCQKVLLSRLQEQSAECLPSDTKFQSL